MKRITLLTLIFVLTTNIFAQNIQTYKSEISKNITIGQATTTQILDAAKDRLILLTNKSKHQSSTSEFKLSDYIIMDVDSCLYINSKIILKDTKEKTLIASNTTQNYIVLLFKESQPKYDIITRIKISKDSIYEINRMNIDTIEHKRNDDVYFWFKSSPHKKYTNYTYVIANNDVWQCNSVMLDDKMDIIWEKQPQTEAINDIAVTDEANLYLIGSHYNIESSSTNFYYENISEKLQNTATFTLNEVLLDSYILKSIDSKIIISGCTYSKESPKKEIYTGGMYSLTYNINDNSHNLEVREFTHEDYCVLYNKDLDTKKIDPYIDNLTIGYTTSTDNGNIITAQRQIYTTKASSNGNSGIKYCNYGIIALKIDNNGHITWERSIRHQQDQTNGNHYLHYALTTNQNTTYIFQVENSKSPQDYNNNEEIKSITPTTTKANIAMYTIDDNGTVTKQIINANTKSAIYGTCPKWFNNHFFYIIGYGDKCQLLTLKISL